AMNFSNVPVKNPTTYSSHYGPGAQHGKPYYELGQECHKADIAAPDRRNPLSLKATEHWQTRPNNRYKEKHLRVFSDPLSSRSCVITANK
ncbi:unnamed protein product, partial [Polarella glacialis]